MKAEQFSFEDRKRFWAKVDKVSGQNGCWLWRGGANKDRYGYFKVAGGCQWAHRAAYVLRHGWIGDGVCVLHQFDNPSYVNPDHLLQGSHADNARDRVRRGRSARGENMDGPNSRNRRSWPYELGPRKGKVLGGWRGNMVLIAS